MCLALLILSDEPYPTTDKQMFFSLLHSDFLYNQYFFESSQYLTNNKLHCSHWPAVRNVWFFPYLMHFYCWVLIRFWYLFTVAQRLSKKKPTDLKFLHNVLFGRKGKVDIWNIIIMQKISNALCTLVASCSAGWKIFKQSWHSKFPKKHYSL
jgi:hypothetical protein